MGTTDGYLENEKKRRFILPPDLVDGDHWVPVDDKQAVLDAVEMWCDQFGDDGDSFTIKVEMMSDAEIEALPEI